MTSARTQPQAARIAFIINDGRALDYFRNILCALESDEAELLVVENRHRASRPEQPDGPLPSFQERSLQDALRSGARYQVVVSTSSTSVKVRSLPRAERRRLRAELAAAGPPRRLLQLGRRRLAGLLRDVHTSIVVPLMRLTSIDRMLLVLTGRPWTGSGTSSSGSLTVPVEALLASVRVLFPHGVDMKSKPPPPEPTPSIWTVALCHGPLDSADRRRRNAVPTCEIGYPRYDHLEQASCGPPFAPLAVEHGRQARVLWLPTADSGRDPGVPHSTILWSPYVRPLLDLADVVVRPHPRDLLEEGALVAALRDQGFEIDRDPARDLGRSLMDADLVLCDFGGTVFSAVYLDRPLLLLEKANGGFDAPLIHSLRKDLARLRLEDLEASGDAAVSVLLDLLQDEAIWREQAGVRRQVRESVFGPSPSGGADRTARFLTALADGSPLRSAAALAGLEVTDESNR